MSDVFERLKKKTRPSVPARDTTLVKVQHDNLQNDQISEFSHLSDQAKPDSDSEEVIKDKVSTSNQKQQIELPQIIRRTIRLEQDIDTNLDSFCNVNKITRDTFLEAAFIVCSENEELLQEVLNQARKRYQQRKQVGEQRKFQTLAKKINVND
jgi:alanyl-tRNA synthetase